MGLHISGGKAGSIDRLKKDMERSSGSRNWIRYIKEGEDLTVRFLHEPEDWYSYREHYSPDVGFFPCVGTDCPGCESDSDKVQRASRRFLACVLDTDNGMVVPLKLPLDLANRLVSRYERYGNTVMDRDYTLHRMGKGLDTTYDVSPEDKSKLDTSRYELLDLEQALLDQFEDAFNIETEADEPKGIREKVEEGKTYKSKAVEVDDDDDIDDEVPSESSDAPVKDESDDEEYLTEEEALSMTKSELVNLAEELGVDIKPNWKKSEIVEAIFASA